MGKTNDQRVAKALEDIRAELDATALSSIAQHLTVVEKEYTTVSHFASSNLDEVNEKNEKIKELQIGFETLKSEKEKISEEFKNIDAIKVERDEYKQKLDEFSKNINSEKKQKFITSFEQIKNHKNFDKIKSKIKLVEKDGSPDWDALDPDDINNNLSKIEEYKELGLLGDISERQDVLPPGRGDVKDPLTLAKTNPAAYKAYRETKGFY